MKKIIILLFALSLTGLCACGALSEDTTKAQEPDGYKTADLYDVQGDDLAVIFTFDKENVDMTFISPSGEEITKGDPSLKWSDGDLWCSYRISDAEHGLWKVKYNKGANTAIEWSSIDN